MRKKYAPEHVMSRDGVYYYVCHIPYDLIAYYNVSRLCFSLKPNHLKLLFVLLSQLLNALRIIGLVYDCKILIYLPFKGQE